MGKPLDAIRVIDLGTGIGGGYLSKLLTLYGASVLHVEPPGGDPLRMTGPFLDAEPGPERSLLHAYLRAGQESLVLDLDDAAGRSELRHRLHGAQVLTDTSRPGVLPSLGLDQAALESEFPALVCTTLSEFGSDGPYAGYAATPAVIHALGGWVHPMGEPNQPPVVPGSALGLYMAALYAAIGTLEALRVVPDVGGQRVEVSIHEAIVATMLYETVSFQVRGVERKPTGRRFLSGDPLQGLFPCKDGWCGIQAALSWMWVRLCDLIEMPELVEDPRYRTPEARGKNASEVEAILAAWAANYTGEEIMRMAQANRIPCHTVPTAEQVFASPHLAARGYWQVVEVEGRDVTVPGLPFRFAGEERVRRLPPAPKLGADRSRVLAAANG